jgi:hypothetical protein
MEGKEIYQSDKQDSDTQKQRGEIHPPFLTDSGKKSLLSLRRTDCLLFLLTQFAFLA